MFRWEKMQHTPDPGEDGFDTIEKDGRCAATTRDTQERFYAEIQERFNPVWETIPVFLNFFQNQGSGTPKGNVLISMVTGLLMI